MILPWCLYFLILYLKKKNNLYFFLYLIFFGLGSSLKMNILVPYLIFNFIFLFFYFDNIQIKIFIFSLISISLFLFLSKLFIGNWLWENPDIRNFTRNYGEPPNISVFTNFNLLNLFEDNLKYPSQSFSYWNTLYYDFFSDYFGTSFMKEGLNINNNIINFKILAGIFATTVFFVYYIYLLINLFLFSKFFSFNSVFILSFFFFFVLSISYSYFVYHKMGGSWNLRYYGIFIYPLVYSFVNQFNLSKNITKLNLNYFLIILIVFFSIFQRINFIM